MFDSIHGMAVHEASHCLLAVHYAHDLVHVRFDHDGHGWAPCTRIPAKPEAEHDGVYAAELAERRLGGEVGARIAAGLALDEIHLPLPGASRIRQSRPLSQIVERLDSYRTDTRHDIYNVLSIAARYAGRRWWQWLEERQESAVAVLQRPNNWQAVQGLATRLVDATVAEETSGTPEVVIIEREEILGIFDVHGAPSEA